MAEISYELLFKDGVLYFEGMVDTVTGLPNGPGSAFDEEGHIIYEGDFVQGECEGKGRELYADGAIKYHGEWLDDEYHGEGALYKQNGTLIHQGQFVQGTYVGGKEKKAATGKKQSEPTDARRTQAKQKLQQLLDELNSLIGLHEVKQEVTTLLNLLKVQKIRKSRGLPEVSVNCHLVLTGNPGTGKTTVARLIAELYGAMGLLSKGHLVEVERSALIGGYLGQTAIKVAAAVESALGGVLFIDEAYNLVNSTDDSYGHEAVSTLLKLMEDHRQDLVVIIAGYQAEIAAFLQTNPGLESRFNRMMHFTDYNAIELFEILNSSARKQGYTLSKDGAEFAHRLLEKVIERKPANFANARFIRNMMEGALKHHSNRIAHLENPTDQQLMELNSADFREVVLRKELRFS